MGTRTYQINEAPKLEELAVDSSIAILLVVECLGKITLHLQILNKSEAYYKIRRLLVNSRLQQSGLRVEMAGCLKWPHATHPTRVDCN